MQKIELNLIFIFTFFLCPSYLLAPVFTRTELYGVSVTSSSNGQARSIRSQRPSQGVNQNNVDNVRLASQSNSVYAEYNRLLSVVSQSDVVYAEFVRLLDNILCTQFHAQLARSLTEREKNIQDVIEMACKDTVILHADQKLNSSEKCDLLRTKIRYLRKLISGDPKAWKVIDQLKK